MNTLFCLTQESKAFHFRVESIPRFLMMKFTVGESEGGRESYPSLWVFLCITSICLYIFSLGGVYFYDLISFQFPCDISVLSSPKVQLENSLGMKDRLKSKEESYIHIHSDCIYMIVQNSAVYGRKSRNRVYPSIIYLL